MRQLLEPSWFSDADVAKREDERVFGRSWQLVGMVSDVPNPGDFVVVRVGGKGWIVRRCADRSIRAFHNVCRHRGARLCESRGHGPIRCRYHAWTYNDAGELVGVPFRQDFGDDFEQERVSLPEARVQTWGPAIFVNPDPNAPPLERVLGVLHPQLDPLFGAMGQLLDAMFMDIDANWKIVMENALETYHVSFVHGETITPLNFKVTHTEYLGASSISHYSAPPQPRKLRAIDFAFPNRPVQLDGYTHANLFPNSTVATAYGNFFVLTRTEPRGPAQTRLHWYMLSTRCDPQTEAAAAAAHMMNESNRAFLRTTFEEDASICARTHEGCREMGARGFLGAQEQRVAAFERELFALLDDSPKVSNVTAGRKDTAHP